MSGKVGRAVSHEIPWLRTTHWFQPGARSCVSTAVDLLPFAAPLPLHVHLFGVWRRIFRARARTGKTVRPPRGEAKGRGQVSLRGGSSSRSPPAATAGPAIRLRAWDAGPALPDWRPIHGCSVGLFFSRQDAKAQRGTVFRRSPFSLLALFASLREASSPFPHHAP
jgi:hypothetical protein